MEYKSNKDIVYSCKYCVVWCSKYRRKVLVGDIKLNLEEIINKVCYENNIDILEMKIMPNYVFLLIEVNPQFGVHKAIKLIKSNSSHILRKQFKSLKTKLPTLWSNSYFISTLGSYSINDINEYIESQKTSQRINKI